MGETLGLRIRLARTRTRMSQAELADRIGISRNAMNRIESGLTDPRASRITAIARALGTTTDYLLGMTDESEPRTECEPAMAS
jgi:transcriptional regulator with XRE-family HTH domain